MHHAPRLVLFALAASLAVGSTAAQELRSYGDDLSGQVSSTPLGWGFQDASAGGQHSLALRSDGTLVSWGSDQYGLITSSPFGGSYAAVSAGTFHSLALTPSGAIEAWGRDDAGQVSMAPTGTGFVDISAGGYHSLALSPSGTITAWGADDFGQVSGTPVGSGFTQISAGLLHNVALSSNGSIVAWGNDSDGQVSGAPTGSGFLQVEAGGSHCIALAADGSLVSWGKDLFGQVNLTPLDAGYVQVAAGSERSYVLRADGTIYGWGSVSPWFSTVEISTPGHTLIEAGATHLVTLFDPDCNGNGISDHTELASGASSDCNGNGVPDECDISSGQSSDLDGNGIPDDCLAPPLYSDTLALSVAFGGTQTFQLAAPAASQLYLLLGTGSGTSPGTPVPGFVLPLNLDAYLLHTLLAPNKPPLVGSFGLLAPAPGGGGQATASLILPAAFDPSLVGLTLHHAFVSLSLVGGTVTFVSNAVPLELEP
ncbi:MAG: hypothetical protein P1V81_12750 [Planctomycetota bacterium]|nr:hypothetical protein [Planctomycetota bacterium]